MCADLSGQAGWQDSISFPQRSLCSPISQASSPGRCCWPLSLIRCGGPSAIRTRTAAKRAFNRPLVPFRQLTFCHLVSANMSQNGIDIDAVDSAVDMPYDIPNLAAALDTVMATPDCLPAISGRHIGSLMPASELTRRHARQARPRDTPQNAAQLSRARERAPHSEYI